jgi:hypothetical protein
MLTSEAGAMPAEEMVEAAARVLWSRGYVQRQDEGEWPAELVNELAELARLGCCRSCPAALTPDGLADHWVAGKEDNYDRSLPTWGCGCGAVYNLVSEWGGQSEFYGLGGDALLGALCAGADRPDSDEDCLHDSCGGILFGTGGSLGQLAGTIRKLITGRVTHSDACPACGRRSGDVIADRTRPQQALQLRQRGMPLFPALTGSTDAGKGHGPASGQGQMTLPRFGGTTGG